MEMGGETSEACGVFGVYCFNSKPAIPYLYWGLIAQNHRGHHSYGFLTFDRGFLSYHSLGLLPPSRSPTTKLIFRKLNGQAGIGHVRYATAGRDTPYWLRKDAQPCVLESGRIKISIAYNGNIVNSKQLKKEMKSKFGNLSSSSDAELIGRKILLELKSGRDLREAVEKCMLEIEGAFSVVGMTGKGELFFFRDPLGIRPLCYGMSEDEEVIAVSSESVGLDINDLRYQGEVQPGELFVISDGKIQAERLQDAGRRAFCSFEFAYFARPDSILRDGSRPVYKIREEFGKNLARENPDVKEKIDVIVSIPETADDAAYGMHIETGIPWERSLRKHRYVTDRAFISKEEERDLIINKKLNIINEISGKRVGAVEDSIVRGDTSRRIVKKIRGAGAKEVHMYVTFPRIISPCFYGIDMATFTELIGFRADECGIAKSIGADSVNYQSMESFVRATGFKMNELCLGCLTCRYPTPMAQKLADEMRVKLEKGGKETGRIYET